MPNENKPTLLEIEKLKLERFKIWERIITVTITVLFGSVLAAYINYSFQDRQLKQQKILREAELLLQQKKEEAELKLQNAKSEADQRQAEMKYLGDFVEHALTNDHKKRLRFADYFSKLTISEELRDRWENYRKGIMDTIELLEKKKVELTKEDLSEEDRKKLKIEVVQLQSQLAQLTVTKRTELNLSNEGIYLENGEGGILAYEQPIEYTNNQYELNSEGKVVFDKATGLMWQQSGSDFPLTYTKANNYISLLNLEGFAEYKDWRLPTLKEAMSLLEPTKMSDDLYINQVFNKTQSSIWTDDNDNNSSGWFVDFKYGQGYKIKFYENNSYVRAVRSIH